MLECVILFLGRWYQLIITTDNIISISEVNKNFTKVTKIIAEKGAAVILKNNAPKYLVIEFDRIEDKEKEKNLSKVTENLIKNGKKAFKKLVK